MTNDSDNLEKFEYYDEDNMLIIAAIYVIFIIDLDLSCFLSLARL